MECRGVTGSVGVRHGLHQKTVGGGGVVACPDGQVLILVTFLLIRGTAVFDEILHLPLGSSLLNFFSENSPTYIFRNCAVKNKVLSNPGVDVIFTFFCDIRQFSVKKLAFYLKTNVMMQV
jgi:hypothetical protein